MPIFVTLTNGTSNLYSEYGSLAWLVVWPIAPLSSVTSLPSHQLSLVNANYFYVNIIILNVNIIIMTSIATICCCISLEPTRILHCNAGFLLNSL